MFLNFRGHNLKHDEFPGVVLVAQADDRLLVVAQVHLEDVHAGIEATDGLGGQKLPQSDRAVARPGHYDVIVWRYGGTPHLGRVADIRSCDQKHHSLGMSNCASKLGQIGPQMGQIWDFLRSVSKM